MACDGSQAPKAGAGLGAHLTPLLFLEKVKLTESEETPEHNPLTVHFNQQTDKCSQVAIPLHRTCCRLFKTLLVSMETRKSTLAGRAAGNCKLRCPKLPLQHTSKPSFGKRNSSSLGVGRSLKKKKKRLREHFQSPATLSDPLHTF